MYFFPIVLLHQKNTKTIGITVTSTSVTDMSRETCQSSVDFHVLHKQEAQNVRVAQHGLGIVTRAMESPSVRQFSILAKLLNSHQHYLRRVLPLTTAQSLCATLGAPFTQTVHMNSQGALYLGKSWARPAFGAQKSRTRPCWGQRWFKCCLSYGRGWVRVTLTCA